MAQDGQNAEALPVRNAWSDLQQGAAAELETEVDGLQSQSIGQGIHYIQGDEPDAIGEALANWLPSILG